jgi:CheY-like chemotaxis protein
VNARDAMPKGGPIIIRGQPVHVADEPDMKPGQYVCISLTDCGGGMDEETLARATEPFFTTKGIGKGTGLGLPMVHGMAQQSGGRLLLKSKVGEGTVAQLCLPAAPVRDPPAREEKAPQQQKVSARKLVILSVDDDPLVALNTTALLEELGHEVHAASSGASALKMLREQAFDLLITDQVMPAMTGLELVAKARQARPQLAVLMATGYAELPEGEGSAIPRLAKPFTQQDLYEAIDRAMAKSRPRL